MRLSETWLAGTLADGFKLQLCVVVILAIAAFLRHHRSFPANSCKQCGYDLAGLNAHAVCPECGVSDAATALQRPLLVEPGRMDLLILVIADLLLVAASIPLESAKFWIRLWREALAIRDLGYSWEVCWRAARYSAHLRVEPDCQWAMLALIASIPIVATLPRRTRPRITVAGGLGLFAVIAVAVA